MTEKALAEAKAYVEKSLKGQAELGYSRPPEPVIEQAVANAAQAINTLMTLSAK
jgi:hypothetical protein